MVVFDHFLVEILQQPIRFFEICGNQSYQGKQNEGYHLKEQKKPEPRLVSKVMLHFVWGHLSRKQTVVVSINVELFQHV